MRRTTVDSKRFPRKLKKEIIKKFGRVNYYRLLCSQVFIQPKIILYYTESGVLQKYEGHQLFYQIKD